MKTSLLLSLLLLSTAACDELKQGDEVVAEDEAAITKKDKLRSIREDLLGTDGFELWYRCTSGSGKDRVTFDVYDKVAQTNRPVRATYTVKDYNGADVEVSTYLGNAKIEMAPNEQLHYVFLFETNGKATRLDTGGESTRPSLTVGTTTVAASCGAYDAPYSVD